MKMNFYKTKVMANQIGELKITVVEKHQREEIKKKTRLAWMSLGSLSLILKNKKYQQYLLLFLQRLSRVDAGSALNTSNI